MTCLVRGANDGAYSNSNAPFHPYFLRLDTPVSGNQLETAASLKEVVCVVGT